jgi:hypothetical protein
MLFKFYSLVKFRALAATLIISHCATQRLKIKIKTLTLSSFLKAGQGTSQ